MPEDDAFSDDDLVPPDLRGPEDPVAYDLWFRAKIEAALANDSPRIPHEEVMRRMQAIIDRRKGQQCP
ncbi:type II toxin-antitoxin system RelB family antitoxin [Sphingobium yanoikuyae]|uniref:type II toxin-antitoxin system RelB family antitoxin n=1 Tax=Sphingobium yanoikuyae TaxID=13690 RepID=UPI00345E26DC